MKKSFKKEVVYNVRRKLPFEIKNCVGKWQDRDGMRQYVFTTGTLGNRWITLIYNETDGRWYSADPDNYETSADIRCWLLRINLRRETVKLIPTDMSVACSDGIAGMIARKMLAA